MKTENRKDETMRDYTAKTQEIGVASSPRFRAFCIEGKFHCGHRHLYPHVALRCKRRVLLAARLRDAGVRLWMSPCDATDKQYDAIEMLLSAREQSDCCDDWALEVGLISGLAVPTVTSLELSGVLESTTLDGPSVPSYLKQRRHTRLCVEVLNHHRSLGFSAV